MLSNTIKKCNLKECLASADGFAPFPRYREREIWESLHDEVKAYYRASGELLADCEWKPLPAVRYMDFYRNGNRDMFQKPYQERRSNLMRLTLAECISGKGTYIDTIINGIWAICEETTWVLPAHINHSARKKKSFDFSWRQVIELPDIEENIYIDLCSAETGSLLTWVYYLLGDEIAASAPLVKRRIELEIKRRILDPYMDDDSFGWMGLSHDNPVNNWNPWINSNILSMYLVMEKDTHRRIRGVEKTGASIQRFIDFYAEDGGCDEGPNYFGAAGAALFDYLEELYAATGGAVDIYGNETIRNIARYIQKVYIGGPYYVNFADSPTRVSAPAGLLARVGIAIGDAGLTAFARHLMASGLTSKQYNRFHSHIYRNISNILEYGTACQSDIAAPKSCWFGGIQVMTARDAEGSFDGLFVAAKGGHNNESHNHNDVGSFILYNNAKPVIIDAGVETYTKKTFSSQRYEIWTMQSCFHNLPRINGMDQIKGRQSAADNVCNSDDGVTAKLNMELKSAYPAEACIRSYIREMVFERGKGLDVIDTYSLSESLAPLVMHLMCLEKPEYVNDDKIKLAQGVTLIYEPDHFSAEIERVPMSDPKIMNDWNSDCLYRIKLVEKEGKKEGSIHLSFIV